MITHNSTVLKLTALLCLCAVFGIRRTEGQESVDRFLRPRSNRGQGIEVRQAQFEPLQVQNTQPRARLRQIASAEYRATIRQHHSQLVVADQKITRIAVTAPEIVNFVQYSEKEVALIGLDIGSTDLTLWFENDPNPVMYEITVTSGTPKAKSPHGALVEVGQKLRTVFPRSRVQLIPVADQVVVKGQAYDAADAEQIMKILKAQFGTERNTVVNMMRVPGEAQVLLRVQIAELSRTQLRKLGVTCRDLLSRSHKAKSFGPTSAGISGVFETNEVSRMMRWLSSNGTISYLAEPTLTVLSGHSASFLSGGEYAVPTVIRDGEKQTQFRNYGTKLKVTPSILDRDLIRLHVSPEFSQIDEKRTVDGIPGTNVRRVETVVELREGQTIAIGGMISRQMRTEVGRKPGLRPRWFSREATEADTELLIVVTPEIVRPMDPTEVPPMPNYYVTHPSDAELFGLGMSEGQPHAGESATVGHLPTIQTSEGCAPQQSIAMPPNANVPAEGQPLYQLPPQPGGSPVRISPSVEPVPGEGFNQQPSSGDQMFELPVGPDYSVNPPPPYPTQPPPMPKPTPIATRRSEQAVSVYSTASQRGSRVQGSVIRPRKPLAEKKSPERGSGIVPASFEAGHSLSSDQSTPRVRPRSQQERIQTPKTQSAQPARIRQIGFAKPVSELPPIGHSIPGTSVKRSESQGRK